METKGCFVTMPYGYTDMGGKYGGCVEGSCLVLFPQLNTCLLYSTLCLK